MSLARFLHRTFGTRAARARPQLPVLDTAIPYRNRKFQKIYRPKAFETEPQNGPKFIIMSYNILCEEYLHKYSHLYKNCPEIPPDVRRLRLFEEIRSLGAEVICLQEMRFEDYFAFWSRCLGDLGYSGVFKRKTGGKADGCATFFKSDVFRLRKARGVNYSQHSYENLSDSRPLDSVGLVTQLQYIRGDERVPLLCVGNTHLQFNPVRNDIRLAQAKLIMQSMQALETQEPSALILCGDLNDPPGSVVEQLVRRDGRAEQMSSVYTYKPNNSVPHNLGSGGCTTCVGGLPKVVDYIYYSQGALELRSRLELLPRKVLKGVAFPNDYTASDHFIIAAELAFKQ